MGRKHAKPSRRKRKASLIEQCRTMAKKKKQLREQSSEAKTIESPLLDLDSPRYEELQNVSSETTYKNNEDLPCNTEVEWDSSNTEAIFITENTPFEHLNMVKSKTGGKSESTQLSSTVQIVTRRLDDMCIFSYIQNKNINMPVREFHLSIESESIKPLLSVCKCTPHKKQSYEDLVRYIDTVNVSSNSGEISAKMLKSAKGSKKYIIFKDMYLKEIDIFCIENRVVVEHFCVPFVPNKIFSEIDKSLDTSAKRVDFISCCWFKREEIYKNIKASLKIDKKSLNYMRKSHICELANCTCCCKILLNNTYATVSNIPDRIVKKRTNILRQVQSNDSTVKLNSLLDYAIKYSEAPAPKNPVKPQHSTKMSLDSKNVKKAVFRIDLKIAESGEKEIYIISELGNILFSTLLPINVIIPGLQLQVSNRCYFKDHICCWIKRERTIDLLIDKVTFPSLSKFLKRNHKCSLYKCTCCCKDKIFIPTKHFKISVHKGNRFACDVEKTNSVASVQTDKKKDLIKQFGKRKDPQKFLRLENNDVVPNKDILDIPHSYNPPTITSTTMPARSSKEESLLVDAILNKFKSVKLTLDDNGKVSVCLSAPANTFTTEKLQLLSKIITAAQKEVDQIKSTAKRPMGTEESQTESLNGKTNPKVSPQNEYLDKYRVFSIMHKKQRFNEFSVFRSLLEKKDINYRTPPGILRDDTCEISKKNYDEKKVMGQIKVIDAAKLVEPSSSILSTTVKIGNENPPQVPLVPQTSQTLLVDPTIIEHLIVFNDSESDEELDTKPDSSEFTRRDSSDNEEKYNIIAGDLDNDDEAITSVIDHGTEEKQSEIINDDFKPEEDIKQDFLGESDPLA